MPVAVGLEKQNRAEQPRDDETAVTPQRVGADKRERGAK